MKKLHGLLFLIAIMMIFSGCIKTNDLIPSIPDQPTPTDVGTPFGDIVSKIIGKTGGSIASADGKAELIFPAGALANDTSISIQALSNTAPNGIGNGYQFLPNGIKFLQPVILKFHYTADDLASTLADLMGIAFQDSIGIWWRVNNFTNDTADKIISAPIKHFTTYVAFDLIFISPTQKNLKVGQSIALNVEIVGSDDKDLTSTGDEIAALSLKPITNQPIIWSVNGAVNGNLTVGQISGNQHTYATFTAPKKVPKPPNNNPVAVSALVHDDFTYHGKIFSKTTLVSYMNIIDGEKYLLELRETESADPFVYTDSASLMVLVSADGIVSFSDITNFPPQSNPTSATLGDCTSTWVQDGIGEINITGATGAINTLPGDPSRVLILQFTHSGTVSPTFKRVCSGGGETTEGGVPIPGFPTVLSFTLVLNGGVYFQNNAQELARLTLQD